MARGAADRAALQPLDSRPAYPFHDDQIRKVARDAFVNWQGSRYSVPWSYAGKEVWLRPKEDGQLEVHHGERQIARHTLAPGRHRIVTDPVHHAGIPLGSRQSGKTLVPIRDAAPVVEIRPLAVYESAGGGR